jgi:RNA polymerase sigma factor (sigma-70 family)
MIEEAPHVDARFADLVRDERAAVVRHLVYLTGDHHLAEDLAQETFGRLLERMDADSLANPRAWLLKVASNLAFNHFRSETRRGAREARLEPPAARDIDESLDVRCAIERLEPRDRAVILLRHSGFSYAEIAESVGLAPSSIGTTLARAQRHFREVYEGTRRASMPGRAVSDRE